MGGDVGRVRIDGDVGRVRVGGDVGEGVWCDIGWNCVEEGLFTSGV